MRVHLKGLALVSAMAAGPALAADGDWATYNRTLDANRLAPFTEVNRANVAKLQPVCTYDMGVITSFQTGPILIGKTLYLTAEMDTVAVDAATCREKWRAHEETGESQLKVNRGAAYIDGRIVRGLEDGRVIAYDADTGKTLWQTRIADPAKGESVPAAPIAWKGMVFIGTAGGDAFNVKGRMYALDAATGRHLWESHLVPTEEDRVAAKTKLGKVSAATWNGAASTPTGGGGTWTSFTLDAKTGLLYVPGGNPAPDFAASLRPGDNLYAGSVVVLDARTGDYRRHFALVPHDYHDWDVAAAPVLIRTKAGRSMMLAAPKDGLLYGYDLNTGKRRYATPVTTRLNVDAPLTAAGTRFCPGTRGGTQWNSPAFSARTNLIYSGTVDWCVTVALNDPEAKATGPGKPWTGSKLPDPYGALDPKDKWGGWVVATDADTGKVRWRYKTNAPVVAAVTPTASGLLFTADMNGAAYAFDAANGKLLWRTMLDGASGGGVISYQSDGRQRVAFTSGASSPIWPVEKRTAKLVVFGLP
jgi:alcohol dehydrogenase (cytochrome c)